MKKGADGERPIPAARLACGEGKGVGEQEETEGYPVMGRIGVGVVCRGPATEQWRRRPVADGGGAAPAVRGGGEWSGSFTEVSGR